ncbi:hypothetical protein HETIRDRAFT_477443 [Heterobasidion irregulare TC 32-1]|uniref:DUF7598 domain-containing protein n=1 Tax=Heterobasidion irregulare (strain TC 32-1) TaxID=747525 RepID=W4K1Z0_HETIT|nr:uncharacterized protein HETIRDRAFT_477443 [Heterobasidion irregulare TC 32-1]ETW79823.1 hypothetical protein HETIRDRAFT_477443 [Heterobasidion irregulare TC 32-1]
MLPPRAYIFMFLNGVRALSIIACILVFASSIVTLVHDVEAVNKFIVAGKANATETGLLDCDYIADSTVPNQPAGAFWAVLNRLLIICQIILLIMSEVGWPQKFFSRFFPVLGYDFGLGALGIIQCLIGAAVLSHHVDDFALVSAFFLFSLGCLNILLGLIFREHAKSKRSIFSWREHAHSGLPTTVQRATSTASTLTAVSTGFGSAAAEQNAERWGTFGFGRQGEKKAGLKGFLLSKPLETLPKYAPSHVSTRPGPRSFESDSTAV